MEDDHDEESAVEGVRTHDQREADEDGVEEDARFHNHDAERRVGIEGRGAVGVREMRDVGGDRVFAVVLSVRVDIPVLRRVRGHGFGVPGYTVGAGERDPVAEVFEEESEEDPCHDDRGGRGFVLYTPEARVREHQVRVRVEMHEGCADDDAGAELLENREDPCVDVLEGQFAEEDRCKDANRAGDEDGEEGADT